MEYSKELIDQLIQIAEQEEYNKVIILNDINSDNLKININYALINNYIQIQKWDLNVDYVILHSRTENVLKKIKSKYKYTTFEEGKKIISNFIPENKILFLTSSEPFFKSCF
jgi:flagellin-like hook-associated protein FlgL